MIKKLNEATALKFKTLSPEEKAEKGILGRLYGKVADFTNGTRNGRKYSEALWENLFNSDLMKERFKSGGVFGQLCHPDYEEVDMEKVAVVMPEPPVKDNDGQLVAYVDIIDTPCGRIAYQLAKYGYKFGISSRGTGDIIDGANGEEVDPDTYQLNAFDLVEIPAVESARLSFTESLNTNKNNLKQSLTEELNSADDNGRKIMTEALNNLGIKLDDVKVDESFEPSNYTKVLKAINDGIESDENLDDLREYLQSIISYCRSIADDYDILVEECKGESLSNKVESEEVVDDKSDEELVAEFQESLKKIKELEQDNLSLQEKLSVGNAKEVQLSEELTRYKNAMVKLSDDVKVLKSIKKDAGKLTEELNEKDNIITTNETRINWLIESRKQVQSKLKSVKESNEKLITDLNRVNEELDTMTKKVKNLSEQLDKSKSLVENYKRSYNALKDKYVEVRANNYGLRKEDVIGKLNESYKIKDVDTICEELNQLKNNMRKLPFRVDENTRVSVKKSSNEYIMDNNNFDDDVSETLLQLADV